MSERKRAALLDGLYRIRYRLLLVNLLVVAVPIVGIGFARFYEREMLRNLEDDMVHQAVVLREMLLADPNGLRLGEREAVLEAAARGTRTRIRLLDNQGKVVADSHRAGPPEGPEPVPPRFLPSRSGREAEHSLPPQLVDPSARAEVRRALEGQYGATTRLWENGDRLFLFSALPITVQGKSEGVVYVTRSTNAVRAALYRFRTSLVHVLGVCAGITAVLSLFLAATISRPLTRLTRAAERIASGDRAQVLRLERRDEIGQLARAIDVMARNLDARARQVRDLAADISHEFKSPLTSLRGAAELLLEGAAEDPEARDKFLRNMLDDAQRLDRLVNRLLELSRVETDDAPRETFDYEAMVRELASRAESLTRVDVQYAARTTQLTARRGHLVSVLRNLIDNALQHAAEGTRVTVRVSETQAGWVRTTVHNQGEPISEANLSRIWGRFFSTRVAAGGTGLGLPIVASVVRAHGGRVEVTSNAADGTTFGFDLPTRPER